MTPPLRLHAIYLSLGDSVFFEASLRSIYQDVEGIAVVTTYDRDWNQAHHEPDDLVFRILSRGLDPDHKIEVLVLNETNEARCRNRAMDAADPRGRSRRVRRQHARDHDRPPVDYFLIVDPDEIYERGALRRLAEHAARRRLPIYRLGAVRYFKRWVYRVDGLEWSTALVRSDHRLSDARNWAIPFWRRAASRLPFLAADLRSAIRRVEDVPADVAVFHHGSYVGGKERIAHKLTASAHAALFSTDWLERVWEGWTPEMKDFNPAWPALYPSAQEVAVESLPAEIADFPWPPGYLR